MEAPQESQLAGLIDPRWTAACPGRRVGLAAEAAEHAASAAKETLRQIFPSTDVEVVEWVLEANEGDLGKSIEALLEMSSGT